ncbi:hypothetical protein JW930_01155 [Candidatus Woesearchaeota archaeon]|nr:hypothetical protein [Candidatus Woesearchaeota archaeon]
MSYLEYALSQDLPNQIVTLIIVLILYPFLRKKLNKTFSLLIVVPAFIGSFFPDASYVILSFIFGSHLYKLSHSVSYLIIVIPFAQVAVFMTNKLLKKELPAQWFIIVALVSFLSACLHLVVDKLGY